MASVNLEDLSIHAEEEEGFIFDIGEDEGEQIDFRWCLLGRFLSDRPIHVNSMKVTMANIWRPVKGVKIKETTPDLFLFQFAHALDMEAVLQGGPWMFDNHMLILDRVQLGVQIENIPLHHVDFWVQVHNLPVGLMAEKVGKKLANYIGSFVEYDKNNNTSIWRQYMRLRVRVDVHQPLKKESKVKNQGGEWCIIKFKYERLGVFCFACGIMGHAKNKCEVRFAKEIDDGVREWSNELRAEPRRCSGRQTSRWLKEEGGGSGNSNGGERNQVDNNSGGPIHNQDVINEVNNNHNHTIIVPHVTPTNNHQIPNPSSQSAIQTDPSISQLSNQTHQHLMSFNVLSQPLLIHD
jgi:14-3-3 protein epsilon